MPLCTQTMHTRRSASIHIIAENMHWERSWLTDIRGRMQLNLVCGQKNGQKMIWRVNGAF